MAVHNTEGALESQIARQFEVSPEGHWRIDALHDHRKYLCKVFLNHVAGILNRVWVLTEGQSGRCVDGKSDQVLSHVHYLARLCAMFPALAQAFGNFL